MNINLFIIFCLFIFSATVRSQNWNRIHMLDQDAEYMIINKLYRDAADNYIRILNELPGNSNLHFRIGYCLLNAEGSLDEAIIYLEKAAMNTAIDANTGSLREDRSPPEAFLYLGRAYQRSGLYDRAKVAYSNFCKMLPADDDRNALCRQHLESLNNMLNLMQEPVEVEVVHLGRNINSEAADVNAVISGDRLTMAFTRITRNGFDVYVARRQGELWGRPVNISSQLRRDFLLTTGISYDGSVLYLVYYYPDRSDIFTSTFENGEWGRVRSIGRPVNSRYNETHASVSADGKTLYFTSDRPEGYGGMDIYRATLDRRGRWQNVENLGGRINTPFNEETPFITGNDRLLFFSSEGHNSMGGYDVFWVDLDNPLPVHNLGYPINNPDDNLFYFPVNGGMSGYISYHDSEGIGRKDIFRLNINDPDNLLAKYPTDDTPEEAYYPETAASAGHEGSDTVYAGIISEDYNLRHSIGESALPAHPAEGRSYSVQFMALQEPIEKSMADTLRDVIIHYDSDGFSRLLKGFYKTEAEAMPVLVYFRENGYPDAFIRINDFIPNYTIQIMAMTNYLERGYFDNLRELICIPGSDGLYRYSYGYYNVHTDAVEQAEVLAGIGYEDLFIKKLEW